MTSPGTFVLSLDFELYWGVRDRLTLEEYGPNIRAVHGVVPRLLDVFSEYGVHCTWATVGFLFLEGKRQLLQEIPAERPMYADAHLSPYGYLLFNPLEPACHFAPHLIRQIAATPGQEMATHTLSHFYTLEAGATPEALRADLQGAIKLAAGQGHIIRSIVFPRNQYGPEHLKVCAGLGIRTYRGVEDSWIYASRNGTDETRLRRAVRLLDSYLNLSGHHTHTLRPPAPGDPFNVPASRFLRPYSPRLKAFEALRLRRITRAMTHAARTGTVYHLWWHPHNFGAHTDENFLFLRRILDHFRHLSARHGLRALNMDELWAEHTQPA